MGGGIPQGDQQLLTHPLLYRQHFEYFSLWFSSGCSSQPCDSSQKRSSSQIKTFLLQINLWSIKVSPTTKPARCWGTEQFSNCLNLFAFPWKNPEERWHLDELKIKMYFIVRLTGGWWCFLTNALNLTSFLCYIPNLTKPLLHVYYACA